MPDNIKFGGNFVFFNLAQKYRELTAEYGSRIPDSELYEATRRTWRMAENKLPHIQYAAAVCEGVIKAVYEVQNWEKDAEMPKKWKFVGVPTRDEPQRGYIGSPTDPFMPRGAGFVVAYSFDLTSDGKAKPKRI